MSDRPELANHIDQEGDRAPGSLAARYGRRALMLGAAATGAGVAASLVSGGLAQAAPGGSAPVLLGKSSTTGGTTSVTSRRGTGLAGHTAVNNQAGVSGINTGRGTNTFGVNGHSVHGPGVHGVSTRNNGVTGNGNTVGFSGVAGIDTCPTRGARGIYGQSTHGNGVLGVSFNGTGVAGTCKVPGQSGVAGVDLTPKGGSHGVFGQSPHGDGVFGDSPNGTGVHAESAHGIALRVQGKMKVSTSGVASVPARQETMTVSVPGMAESDIVLVTIQDPQPGVAVAGARAGADSFTVMLTGPAENSIRIGWLVLG